MVTRTITTTSIKAKIYNVETDQIEEKVIEKAGKLDAVEAEKVLSKDGIKVLKICNVEHATELTGMSEEEWRQHSHKLPPRVKKAEA